MSQTAAIVEGFRPPSSDERAAGRTLCGELNGFSRVYLYNEMMWQASYSPDALTTTVQDCPQAARCFGRQRRSPETPIRLH